MRTEILHYFTFPAANKKQNHKYLSQIGNSSQPYDRTQIAGCRVIKIINQKF